MTEFLNTVSFHWWQWMSAMFWQVSLLILVVWFLDIIFRKRMWPQLRHALWLIVFIKLVIPPHFSLSTGVFQNAQPLAENVYKQLILKPEKIETDTNIDNGTNMQPPVEKKDLNAKDGRSLESGISASGTATLGWQFWPFALWISGVFVFAALLGANILRLRRWHIEQDKIKTIPKWFNDILIQTADELKLERLPAVVFSDQIQAPAVYGFFRPVLLLPHSFTKNLTREELSYMTLHELMHLKRKDLWLHGITMVLQILYWFNPLVFWANRHLKHVREISCDMTIANQLKEKTAPYRMTLINAARRLLTNSVAPAMGFLGVFEEPYRIINRIKWLEKDMSLNKFMISIASIFLVTLFFLFVVPMSPSSDSFAASAPGLITLGDDGLLAPVASQKDLQGKVLYSKQETRTESLFMGFVVESKLVSIEEMWTDGRKIALKEEGKKFIVDLDENKYSYLNDLSESYIQAQMPLDVELLRTEDVNNHLKRQKIFGEVIETGRTKTMFGVECREYRFNRWQIRNSLRRNQGSVNIWLCNDFPISSNALEVLLDNRRKLLGASEEVRTELRKLKGFQLVNDFDPDIGLFGTRMISETKALELRTAPEGVFDIPKHYCEKRKFTREDFN